MNIPARLPAIFSVIVLSLVLALPAGAEDFGSTVTLPNSTHSDWDTTNHKLDDNATTVTVTSDYTLSGDISGTGRLIKDGSGALTLSGNNTYSGGTVLQEGTLNIGNNKALGTEKLTVSGDIQQSAIKFTGAHTIDNDIEIVNANGTSSLFIDSGEYDVTIAGNISDSGGHNGALTKVGEGTLTLTGANDYEGKTTIIEGTLRAGGAEALDEGVYAINDGTLDLNGHDLTMLGLEGNGGEILLGTADLTIKLNNVDPVRAAAVISGQGSFTLTGDSTLILTGDNTYTGGTTVSGGTLQIGRGARGSIVGNILNNANLTFNRSGTVDYDGDISGTGSLTKEGEGVLTLTGDNTYSSGTTVSAGILAGNIAEGTDLTVASGAAYDGAGAARSVNALSGGGMVVNSGGLTVQSGDFGGDISGAGALTKTGTGTLTLSGANNSYTGMTTVRSGVLALGGALTASSGLTLHEGATFKTGGHTHSLNGKELTVWGGGSTYDGDLSANDATMNFIAPGVMPGAMLTVSGKAEIQGGTVNLNLPGSVSLPAGTKLSLLKAASLSGEAAQGDGFSIQTGATVVHDITLESTADELFAQVAGGRATAGSKALSEGFVGGLSLVTQGADVIAGQGMDAAVKAARADLQGGYGASAFGTVSGGSVKYNTGSHVDLKSVSLATGLSFGAETSLGRVTAGAFFEYGDGSYDTHNSFSNAPSVNGRGDMDYLGGGVLGRLDFLNTGPGHAYVEASLRTGRMHNEYDSSDLRFNGVNAAYESSTPYYGAHLGTGYVWNITDKASLDLYGKYFWTRQQGDGVTLSTGESVQFEDADSHRLRGGARFSYTVNEYVSPYVGAAWEHEFDGRAGATTNGYSIDAPDLKGSTGIGEIGLSFKPSPDSPLALDLGLQGYTGQREGLTGTFRLKWEF